MQRILIIGISGAGKSTFAQELARRTRLPLIHLDKEFWLPGWQIRPTDSWRDRVVELAAGPAWIMDGNYDRTLDLRLPRADTVVWFQMARHQALWRAIKRSASSYGVVRSDMAPGCPEKWDPNFWRYIWNFNAARLPRIEATLLAHGQHARVIIVRKDSDATAFLANVPSSAAAV